RDRPGHAICLVREDTSEIVGAAFGRSLGADLVELANDLGLFHDHADFGRDAINDRSRRAGARIQALDYRKVVTRDRLGAGRQVGRQLRALRAVRGDEYRPLGINARTERRIGREYEVDVATEQRRY